MSKVRKAETGKTDRNVVVRMDAAPSAAFYSSVITIMELETGIPSVNRRGPVQRDILRLRLDACVLHTFADRLLPVTLAVARRCASLHVPNPQPERDALIAATALVHGMTVVTRNVADFRSSGVPVFNPWNA